MAKKLIVDQSKVNQEVFAQLEAVCPFGGLEYSDGKISFTAGCKMCGLCVRKGPAGVITMVEEKDETPKIDKSKWNGVSVYIEADDEGVHPVSYELIGKAQELAKVINHPALLRTCGATVVNK